MTLDKHPDAAVVYCNTMSSEHPDNARFMADVERWLGVKVEVISSSKYADVDEVIQKRRYMAGPNGALCTVEMKKVPRFQWQRADDIHVFGYTSEEGARAKRFEGNNPELALEWPLINSHITRAKCYQILQGAGIELPAMYGLGYRNNNCIGCVKATSPRYWALVRDTFPEVFAKRVAQSEELGVKLVSLKGKRIMLSELPQRDYSQERLPNLTCGPECAPLGG
jgi:hypothetical protein